MLNPLFADKVRRVLTRKTEALLGRLHPLKDTIEAMSLRPFELHLELTNLCNADCIFCPYHLQQRPHQFMPDEIFHKAVADFLACGGGSVGLTPIVGDAFVDRHFLDRVRYLRSQPAIDRLWVTTNAILLDRFGIEEVLDSGLNAINISTAGFDRAMYERVYRNRSYDRMRRNVQQLVEKNARRAQPLSITICLRPDRPLEEVLRDPDFQPVLAHNPALDFTWSYTTANGRIQRRDLPESMKIRTVPKHKREMCVQLLNGPIVLADGSVLACSCVAAMDALPDLHIGHILREDLLTIWTGHRLREIRAGFRDCGLNPTCSGCDMYRDLELYRTREGRRRAALNRERLQHGPFDVLPQTVATGPFSGG